MNKSKKQPVRFLSDGTIAKVGRIVVVIKEGAYGNEIGAVTRVTKTNIPQYHDYVFCEEVGREGLFGISEDERRNRGYPLIPSWYENIDYLRSATKEERQQYYSELYKRNGSE